MVQTPPANRVGTGRFEGKIGRTLAESEPWFEEAAHPGEQSPNVVVVLLDDTGFAHRNMIPLLVAAGHRVIEVSRRYEMAAPPAEVWVARSTDRSSR